MPKTPIDYSKTIIYKLVNKEDIYDENIYIGHSTNMVQRKRQHKKCCCNPNNKEYNDKKYQYIRENGGWDKWDMILVEKYPCNDVNEAKARERHWIKELKSKLNIYEPCRTMKEWREDNKEKIKEHRENNKERMKEYRQNNKEKIKEQYIKYREANKQKIANKKKEYYENNKEKICEKKKQYYENNKEKINQKHKEAHENNRESRNQKTREYYENNKEEINQKRKEKTTCECGSVVSKHHISTHRKTIKHQELIKKN